MKVEILGMNCSKCNMLYDNVKKAIEEKGIKAEIVKIDNINRITEYNIMMTPALVIDGNVKSSGKVLSVEEIKKCLA
jgi:small redox-active disulfide protein 2